MILNEILFFRSKLTPKPGEGLVLWEEDRFSSLSKILTLKFKSSDKRGEFNGYLWFFWNIVSLFSSETSEEYFFNFL